MARQAYIKRFGNPIGTFGDRAHGALHVVIVTKRLRISSISKKELEYYVKLFGDSTVMRKCATGDVKDREYTEQRIDVLAEQWKNRIAFSGFSIWLKDQESKEEKDKEEFLGHAFLVQRDERNSAELGYAVHANQWNQGYASEAAGAVVLFYARELASAGYKLPDGSCLKRIFATVRTDNPASSKVLERIGFTYYKQHHRYGSPRNYYEIQMENLLQDGESEPHYSF